MKRRQRGERARAQLREAEQQDKQAMQQLNDIARLPVILLAAAALLYSAFNVAQVFGFVEALAVAGPGAGLLVLAVVRVRRIVRTWRGAAPGA